VNAISWRDDDGEQVNCQSIEVGLVWRRLERLIIGDFFTFRSPYLVLMNVYEADEIVVVFRGVLVRHVFGNLVLLPSPLLSVLFPSYYPKKWQLVRNLDVR